MNKTITAIVILIILAGVGLYFINRDLPNNVDVNQGQATTTPQTDDQALKNAPSSTIGMSVEGRDILAYSFGTGEKEILFIGGIHGGYEWNTVLLAYQTMDYLDANPGVIPKNMKVTIIPVLNPDGLNKVVGSAGRFTSADVPSSQSKQVEGRFNGNTVDLGRNFDCDWKSSALWQNKSVSGGSSVFSEPESQAIKKYVEDRNLTAVVTWYSAVGGVFASSCHNGVSPETNILMKKYAEAAGYPAYESFDFYAITGDMVNWFARENVPAISVLLTNHTDTEWSKNKAGLEALLQYYSK